MTETNFPSTVALEIRGPIETQTMSKLYYSLKSHQVQGVVVAQGFGTAVAPAGT